MEQRVVVMGTGFDPVTLEEAAKRIAEWVDGWNGAGPLKQVVTANPEVVMLARRNPGVAQVVRRADLVTADGIGVVLASKWLGTPVPERVTGADLADRLLGFAGQRKWRVYLLGASSASLGGALAELRRHYPEVDWHGHHGYFDQQGEKEILQEIAEVRPHLLFVGMGAPRQDLWIARHRDLPVGVAMGIGGTIDVWSGAVKRAPVAWQRLHLEWLYRLIRQPSRIRRQLVLPHFALLALGAALTMRRRGGPGPK
ncbi:glycosyltransferase [Kyrpidia spormannii]|uniref:N-acetylglucosaminyldiphosphoundecaprenol N-acetyl-beta-D-mannosaminyltransferase n=1 Tax=Kyrpidia spormannii TaxID=2055160 RepID=A0A2K8N9R9_9BACL|nr:WecB/TagA/CpsF family glycosyltransferase [Kyrpidia spormannii]ATY86043.1 glycosyltransferase [Kyrpidia spormannii]